MAWLVSQTYLLCIILHLPLTANSNNTNYRISHGQYAYPHQFPHQVSVRHFGKHYCGGSIISHLRIISAAHCVTTNKGKSEAPQNFQILAGTNYVDNYSNIDDNLKSVLKAVSLIFVHHKYNYYSSDYDVAVLILNTPFDLKWPHIAIVALSTIWTDSPETECVVSGWGMTEKKIFPNKLMFLYVGIVSTKTCVRKMSPIEITRQMICALGEYEGDAEVGDSGGPLVCDDKLEGIVSFGMFKRNKSLTAILDGTPPGVYTRVSEVGLWALTTTNQAASKNRLCIVLIFGVVYLDCICM